MLKRVFMGLLLALMMLAGTTCQAYFDSSIMDFRCIYADQKQSVFVEQRASLYSFEENTCDFIMCEHTLADGHDKLSGIVFDFDAATYTVKWEMLYDAEGSLLKCNDYKRVKRNKWQRIQPGSVLASVYEVLEPKG